MEWIVFALLTGANLVLFFQDVKSFAIHWISLVISSCLAIFWGLINNGIQDFLTLGLANMVLFAVILSLAWVFIRIRRKSIFFTDQIGLGDILYVFLVLCFLFHPFLLILFFICSSAVSLLVFLFFRKKWDRVPLAGLLALQLVLWLLVSRILGISLYIFPYGT